MKTFYLVVLIPLLACVCACGKSGSKNETKNNKGSFTQSLRNGTAASFGAIKHECAAGAAFVKNEGSVILAKVHKNSPENNIGQDTEYRTNPSNYSAMPKSNTLVLRDGLQGLVKVFSDHAIDGIGKKGKSVSASFPVQGAGSVVTINGQMFVVTAKHVVVPNRDTKSITYTDKKQHTNTVEFDKVTGVGAKVLVGPLGVVPESVWLSKDYDVAVLQIQQHDQKSVLDGYFRDPSAPVGIANNSLAIVPGQDVESWGFPAKQNPQVEKVTVASTDANYIVLNRALLRGFSGGSVFLKNGNIKIIGGIIFRADEQSNQTYVLPWNLVANLLDAAKSKRTASGVVNIKLGDTTRLDGVSYRFKPFYNL